MWDVKVAGISIYEIFYNFFIYSFFGWIYESIYVSVREKKWVNRGFLNGPVIPIYGASATLLYIAFFNDRMLPVTQAGDVVSILVIFVSGMVLASLLEFVTSWTMEKLFHARWWDYSECFMNIQGRVCLKASLFWGFLSVVMAELLQPAMSRLIARLPRPMSEYLGYLIFVVFAADFTVTMVVTLKLDAVLGHMQRLREELYEAVAGHKWQEVREEFRTKLESSKAVEFLESIKANAEKHADEYREKVQTFTEQYREKHQNGLQKYIFRRLMKAYPNMKMKKRTGAFHDLRENLLRKAERKADKK